MAKSKGICQHPIFKLGKAPAKRDPRKTRAVARIIADCSWSNLLDFTK